MSNWSWEIAKDYGKTADGFHLGYILVPEVDGERLTWLYITTKGPERGGDHYLWVFDKSDNSLTLAGNLDDWSSLGMVGFLHVDSSAAAEVGMDPEKADEYKTEILMNATHADQDVVTFMAGRLTEYLGDSGILSGVQ